jgi:site-specific DNA-methyltransferase (adenine-specific)
MAGYIQTAKSQDWGTPYPIVEHVYGVFGGTIDLDPCGNPGRLLPGVDLTILFRSGKPERVGVIYDDGLQRRWTGNVYCNPPYGPPLDDWLAKMAAEGTNGANVIGLLPVATSRKAWQHYVPLAHSVCFIKGRLRFEGAPSSAGFSSAMVLWSDDEKIQARFRSEGLKLGHVMLNP